MQVKNTFRAITLLGCISIFSAFLNASIAGAFSIQTDNYDENVNAFTWDFRIDDILVPAQNGQLIPNQGASPLLANPENVLSAGKSGAPGVLWRHAMQASFVNQAANPAFYFDIYSQHYSAPHGGDTPTGDLFSQSNIFPLIQAQFLAASLNPNALLPNSPFNLKNSPLLVFSGVVNHDAIGHQDIYQLLLTDITLGADNAIQDAEFQYKGIHCDLQGRVIEHDGEMIPVMFAQFAPPAVCTDGSCDPCDVPEPSLITSFLALSSFAAMQIGIKRLRA